MIVGSENTSFPSNFGFRYPLHEIRNFYIRWRRSEYMLTITGSYERDQEEYADFWSEIYLYDSIQQRAIQKARNSKKVMDTLQREHAAPRRGM